MLEFIQSSSDRAYCTGCGVVCAILAFGALFSANFMPTEAVAAAKEGAQHWAIVLPLAVTLWATTQNRPVPSALFASVVGTVIGVCFSLAV